MHIDPITKPELVAALRTMRVLETIYVPIEEFASAKSIRETAYGYQKRLRRTFETQVYDCCVAITRRRYTAADRRGGPRYAY